MEEVNDGENEGRCETGRDAAICTGERRKGRSRAEDKTGRHQSLVNDDGKRSKDSVSSSLYPSSSGRQTDRQTARQVCIGKQVVQAGRYTDKPSRARQTDRPADRQARPADIPTVA